MKTEKLLSQAEKDKNDKQWYKDTLDTLEYNAFFGDTPSLDKTRLRVNYNLFNGEIDKRDFEYVYKPLGEDVGDLPADFTNKDIISGKMKVLLGMELERPFAWRINAVNPEATTRKEEEKMNRIRNYVTQQIMLPIQQNIEMKYAEQMKGENLSPEEQQQIQQTIASEIEAQTPEEVDHYMKRKHQDPVEIMMSQIFNYVIKEQNVDDKFNLGWKHSIIAAAQIYWSGIINGKPVLQVVNPMDFECDDVLNQEFIEDGEWAGVELWLGPSEVVSMFEDLTDPEIKQIYDLGDNGSPDLEFNFNNFQSRAGKVRILHRVWRAMRKIGFLSYINMETGTIEQKIVDEGYKLNEEFGDLNIQWEQIPEVYEGYKIGRDIYKRLRPVPSQPKDMDNLYDVKLPYTGGFVDNLNAQPVSLLDRVKVYQYYYNIIMYRIEMLMSSDKGKLLLLNMNLIPNSQGIDMKKWLYYADSLKIGFMNPSEEGNRKAGNVDVATAAKEIDMSLVSDIQKYIGLAEYIEIQAGNTIGVTKEMEGRIGQYQAVKNTENALQQGSYIVEPYFNWHNIIKRNTLTYFLELSALAYSSNNIEVIDHVLDDFSREIIRMDKSMLSLSKFGLFVANSMDAIRVKEAINNLSLTAMQNQALDMSDVIKIMKTDSITDAEEQLEVAEERKRKQANQMEQERMAHEKKKKKMLDAEADKQHEREKELIILKEEERRKTEIQKQTILAMGFNEDKDMNDNGVPDVLEIAKHGLDVNLKTRKQDLDENKFEHQKKVDADKKVLEEKKLKQQKAKQSSK